MTIFEALPELYKLIGKRVRWLDDPEGILVRIVIDDEDVWFVINDGTKEVWCSAVCGVTEIPSE